VSLCQCGSMAVEFQANSGFRKPRIEKNMRKLNNRSDEIEEKHIKMCISILSKRLSGSRNQQRMNINNQF
jgi:hypothetical protein